MNDSHDYIYHSNINTRSIVTMIIIHNYHQLYYSSFDIVAIDYSSSHSSHSMQHQLSSTVAHLQVVTIAYHHVWSWNCMELLFFFYPKVGMVIHWSIGILIAIGQKY